MKHSGTFARRMIILGSSFLAFSSWSGSIGINPGYSPTPLGCVKKPILDLMYSTHPTAETRIQGPQASNPPEIAPSLSSYPAGHRPYLGSAQQDPFSRFSGMVSGKFAPNSTQKEAFNKLGTQLPSNAYEAQIWGEKFLRLLEESGLKFSEQTEQNLQTAFAQTALLESQYRATSGAEQAAVEAKMKNLFNPPANSSNGEVRFQGTPQAILLAATGYFLALPGMYLLKWAEPLKIK